MSHQQFIIYQLNQGKQLSILLRLSTCLSWCQILRRGKLKVNPIISNYAPNMLQAKVKEGIYQKHDVF
jgi:site-specific recombinase XerC